jgi:hypothetical protein
MGVVDALTADGRAVLGHLRSTLDQVAGLGGVADLAGHPAAIRGSAQMWRETASDLRSLEQGLTGPARSAESFWQESSAHAFAAQWSMAAATIGSLATDLDRAARGLDDAAAQLDREVQVLETVVGDVEGLVAILSGGADPVSLLSAVQRAPALVGQLQGLLHEIEAVWGTVSGLLRSLGLTFVHVMGDVANWVGQHGLEISKLALDAGQTYVGLEMVAGGLGLDAGGLVLDATGVGAVVGVPADVAGTAMVVGGAGLATYGASQTGRDLGHLMSKTDPASSSGNDAAAIGAAREKKVAELTGGKVQGEPGQPGLKIVEPGVGPSDVDVIGKDGEYIAVGGPAKAGSLSDLGRKLRILKYAADNQGVPAQAYFERGTPETAINVAKRALGDNNVFIFDR